MSLGMPRSSLWLSALPGALTAFRLMLAPALLGLSLAGAPGLVLLACLAAGFLSDVADGMVARRLGVATPALRRFDCVADIAFHLAVLGCAGLRYPQVVAEYAWPIAALLLAEAACQTISLARFGHTTATHAYLCKAWAVLLFASAALLLGFGVAGALLPLTLLVGGLAYLDVLLILSLARTPPVDVPSAFHVWRVRRAMDCSPRRD